jgi:hypothetical protein
MKYRTFIGTVCFLSLHLFAGEGLAQSRIDSIQAKVEALNKHYQQEMTVLYEEMLALSEDESLSSQERVKAKSRLYLFPIEENIDYLLDSLDYLVYSDIEGQIIKTYPYWDCISKLMFDNQLIITRLKKRLQKDMNVKELELISWNYESFYRVYGHEYMSNKEKAASLRIIANSDSADSKEKENLLKIADIIDRRSGY